MDNSVIKEIKERIDIVDLIGEYIKLKKTGSGYQGLCPFHAEKNPSFYVSPQRQTFKCFGCGAYGDIFTFIMKIEGVEFKEALTILAQKAGVELKHFDPALNQDRQLLFQLCEDATRFFEKQLKASTEGKKALTYLLKRGIKESSIKKWRLGYAPDQWRALTDFLLKVGFQEDTIVKSGLAIPNEARHSIYDRFRGRIIFPIAGLSGRIIGFGGRVMPGFENQGAKYINTPTTLLYDKSQVLYGLDKARVKIRELDQVILVEGYTDVIMSHQAGFTNTVSVSGTALTASQVDLLKRYSDKIVVAFDMDEAGRLATQRSVALLQEKGFLIRIVNIDNDLDPAEMIIKSPKIWEKAVKESQSIFDFYFQRAFSKYDKETPEGRTEILQLLLPLLAKIPNKIEQSHWIQKLAQDLNVREESIISELSKGGEKPSSRPRITIESTEETNHSLEKPSRAQQLEERILGLIVAKEIAPDFISSDQVSLFSLPAQKILQLWKKGRLQRARKRSRDLDNFLNALALAIDQEKIEAEKELELCLTEFSRLKIKEKLEDLSQEIKKAEKEKKNKVLEKLIKKFKELSQELIRYDQNQNKK